LRIGIALGIHGAVTRRHNQIVRPAALEQALSIPEDLAAVTAAVADGDAELARILMREHIDAWNRRTNG
jgi:DNA-binding FadR family transcriptional regulator